MEKPCKALLFFSVFLSLSTLAGAQQVWDQAPLTFTKTAFTNPSEPENQDNITDEVWLTRGSTQGIYNAKLESSFSGEISPVGTRWAFSGLNANPSGAAFSAANYDNLNFNVWADSLGGMGFLQGNILDRPAVLHLVSQDIYIDITFTAWSGGSGGGSFSYTRASESTTIDNEINIPFPNIAIALLGLLIITIKLSCIRLDRTKTGQPIDC